MAFLKKDNLLLTIFVPIRQKKIYQKILLKYFASNVTICALSASYSLLRGGVAGVTSPYTPGQPRQH